MHYTITGLGKNFEPNVPDAFTAVKVFKELSNRIGPERMLWRFDPVVLTRRIGEQETVERFEGLLSGLAGSTQRVYFSFVELYARVLRRIRNYENETGDRVRNPDCETKFRISQRLAGLARDKGMSVHACWQPDLTGFGIEWAHCIDANLIARLTGKIFECKPSPTRKSCGMGSGLNFAVRASSLRPDPATLRHLPPPLLALLRQQSPGPGEKKSLQASKQRRISGKITKLMAMKAEPIKREMETALVFALGRDPNPALLDGIQNWRAVCDFLLGSKTAGVFYRRLLAAKAGAAAPAPELERLRQFYYFSALKNKVLLNELNKIREILAGKNIRLIVLKGASLILSGAFQPGERYQCDLDFLIEGMGREELRGLLKPAGYLPVAHSDQHWWSEEHFIRGDGRRGEEMFSVFLEFHWTFRPLNRCSGKELAEAIFEHSEPVVWREREYIIPTAELRFFQAGIHGSAYHAFESGYFWVALADLGAIANKRRLDFSLIAGIAEKQGMLEHLGIMGWVLAEKLSLDRGLWQEVVKRAPQLERTLATTGQAVWRGLLGPHPVSFANLVHLFGQSHFRSRVRACLKLAGLYKGESVEVEGTRLNVPPAGFLALSRSRFKRLDREFVRLVWQMARFYRKIKFQIPKDS